MHIYAMSQLHLDTNLPTVYNECHTFKHKANTSLRVSNNLIYSSLRT